MKPLCYSCFYLLILFRQIILSRVTLGKPFFQFTAVKMAHAPPGHHSVIGKPNAGGLSYPEYVVYRGEQVIICLLGTHDLSSLAFLY